MILIGSIGAGLEGIQHPERWEEGGENYSAGERNKPPGVDNIVFGTLVYTGYFGYHQSKRDKSLINILNEYNTSKFFYSDIEVPNIKNISKKRYDFRYQVGLFSEKTTTANEVLDNKYGKSRPQQPLYLNTKIQIIFLIFSTLVVLFSYWFFT